MKKGIKKYYFFQFLILMGCITGGLLTKILRANEQFQDVLDSPVGITLVGMLVFITLVSLIIWGQNQANKPLFYTIILITAINIAIATLATDKLGWIGGMVARPPLCLRVMVYGLGFLNILYLPLLLYRWIKRKSILLALFFYFSIIILFSLLTIPVENEWLRSGIYKFGNGYNMFYDISWGILMWVVALIFFEYLEYIKKITY